MTSASLLEKYQKAEEQPKRNQHIDRIKSSVYHLTEILEEFLSVGKLESGKVEINLSTNSLHAFIDDLLLDLKSYESLTQQIQLSINDDVLWTTDFSILRKILINGLSNALKFSQKDVHLMVDVNSQELIIRIIDKGIGISKEDQKHLFERFFRGSNATVIPGTGLGLHLIDQYVKLLKGSLEIISETDKGTELIIRLNRI